MARAGINELADRPESLVVIAGSRVFKPVYIVQGECPGKDVEIAVTVHVVEVFGVVLHVVGSEGQDLAERTLLEFGRLIPKFTGGNIEFAVPVDVTNGDTFVVVLVKQPHTPLLLRSTLVFISLLRRCANREY